MMTLKSLIAVLAVTAMSMLPHVDRSTAFSSSPQRTPHPKTQTPPPTKQTEASSSILQNNNLLEESQQPQQQTSRRDFFGSTTTSGICCAATAVFLSQQPEPANAAIKTGAANSFTGDYDDPNHPGCLRQVKVVGAPLNGSGTRSAFPVIEITGWDGETAGDNTKQKLCKSRPPGREYLWQVNGSVRSPTTALVDFSLRGGGMDPIPVKYENGGIIFPDGNKWKKIPEQKDRRPKDMSTLSDGPKFRERNDDDYDY